MHIYGVGPLHGPHALNPAHFHRARGAGEVAAATLPSDEVQISQTGHLLEQISNLPEIRHERVAQIKQAIAAGAYDDPDRLSLAVDRLLDEIA